jgi:fatty-acyl-CoA synthase
MYRLMMGIRGQERYDLSSLRRVAFSSEPMPLELAEALHERTGASLENIYGTTEAMLISWTTMQDGWERAATTVGRAVPGARIRILDPAGGEMPPGEEGEVVVRTPQMMLGYHNSPDLTAKVLDSEGWLRTGDLGIMGDDGYLRLRGRKDDLIIRGGQNIHPAEIEQCLESDRSIRRAGVVGVPGGVGGEAVWAFVEPQPGASLKPADVFAICRNQIAPYKAPAQVRFVERLPVTATGKVQRYRLREMVQERQKRHDPA